MSNNGYDDGGDDDDDDDEDGAKLAASDARNEPGGAANAINKTSSSRGTKPTTRHYHRRTSAAVRDDGQQQAPPPPVAEPTSQLVRLVTSTSKCEAPSTPTPPNHHHQHHRHLSPNKNNDDGDVCNNKKNNRQHKKKRRSSLALLDQQLLVPQLLSERTRSFDHVRHGSGSSINSSSNPPQSIGSLRLIDESEVFSLGLVDPNQQQQHPGDYPNDGSFWAIGQLGNGSPELLRVSRQLVARSAASTPDHRQLQSLPVQMTTTTAKVMAPLRMATSAKNARAASLQPIKSEPAVMAMADSSKTPAKPPSTLSLLQKPTTRQESSHRSNSLLLSIQQQESDGPSDDSQPENIMKPRGGSDAGALSKQARHLLVPIPSKRARCLSLQPNGSFIQLGNGESGNGRAKAVIVSVGDNNKGSKSGDEGDRYIGPTLLILQPEDLLGGIGRPSPKKKRDEAALTRRVRLAAIAMSVLAQLMTCLVCFSVPAFLLAFRKPHSQNDRRYYKISLLFSAFSFALFALVICVILYVYVNTVRHDPRALIQQGTP